MNRTIIRELGGTGCPCSSRPHPVPENRHTAAGERGVEQVEQGISILGNIKTTLTLVSSSCLRGEYNANTLFHLFHRGRRPSRRGIIWNRVPCSTPPAADRLGVMT